MTIRKTLHLFTVINNKLVQLLIAAKYFTSNYVNYLQNYIPAIEPIKYFQVLSSRSI